MQDNHSYKRRSRALYLNAVLLCKGESLTSLPFPGLCEGTDPSANITRPVYVYLRLPAHRVGALV